MGLLVREDGYYHGWLASILCCCAAIGFDEHPAERIGSQPTIRSKVSIVHEQPSAYDLPPYPHARQRPLRTQYTIRNSRLDIDDNHYTPSPPLKPLDFGPSSLFARTVSGTFITPISFDHIEAPEQAHRGLIPLRLAPVVLGEPSDDLQQSYPVEFKHQRSGSGDALLPSAPPESYRLSRESPFQRLVRRSTDALVTRQSQVYDGDVRLSKSYSDPHVNLVPSRTPSAQSDHNQPSIVDDATSGLSDSSTDNNVSSAPRPKRKRSVPTALRLRNHTDTAVDQDAAELNTIAEEQRIDSPRSVRSPVPRSKVPSDSDASSKHRTTQPQISHVPAVAPTMQMEVRSETLNDIGSALSRPVTARSDHKDFDDFLREQEDVPSERRARSASQVAKIRSRSGSRVSGWLNSIRASNSHSAAMPDFEIVTRPDTRDQGGHPPTNDKRESKHRSRKHSQPSWSSSATNADVQSVTAASTPSFNANGHSRSLTADSRITSPPSTIAEADASVKPVKPSAAIGFGLQPTRPDFSNEKEVAAGRSRESVIAKTERLCEEEGWTAMEQPQEQAVGMAF